MKAENMNATQFAEAIGIQRAAMSHIMKGRNNPSADVLVKISDRFDTINPGWLLSGKGNMRIASSNESGDIDMTGGFISNTSTKHSNESLKVKNNTTNATGDEPDLFHQHDKNGITAVNTHLEDNTRTEVHFSDKTHKGNDVNELENICKHYEKEIIVYKEKAAKIIDKLLIFYSDNTYETFIPEKRITEK